MRFVDTPVADNVAVQASVGAINRYSRGGQLDAVWMNTLGDWRVGGTLGAYSRSSATGTRSTETPALLAYVAQSFPEARLAPADAHGFARLQEFHSYLASTVHIAHAHRPRASRWADEPEAQAAMQRKVPQNMTECFNLIESHYLPKADQGPWVMGEQYTVADGYLFTIGTWLKSDGVDIASFPKVFAHTQRMLERPAVQRALA